MRKKTILLCGPPVTAVGGGPTHIRNMLDSSLKERFKLVHLETGSRGKESPAKDEGSIKKIWRIATSPLSLLSVIRREKPSIIHINTAISHKPFWRDAVYVVLCKLMRQKVLLQTHGGSLKYLTALPGMRYIVRKIYSSADAIVVLAKSEVRDFEALDLNKKLYIIANAVDLNQYTLETERIHSGTVNRVAFISRLIRPKGIFEVMKAIKIMHTEPIFRDVKLSIAGSGPAREEIEKWIHDNGMKDCIKLVGAVYGPDKVNFLHEADVVVFPTYHREGLPYVIIESLAAGTPVVASRVAGIPDIVVDGKHGKLIEAKDPSQIVAALRELSQSPEGLRSMSKNCKEWANERLGLDRLAVQFAKLYEELTT